MNRSAYTPQANSAIAQAWRLERFKIGFQYALVLLAAMAAGWLFATASDTPITQEQANTILGHFFSPISSLPSARQALLVILSLASSSLIGIALVFLFSFSAINCLINNGILLYFGARTGYTVSILLWVVTHSEQIGPWHWLLFAAFKTANAVLLLFHAFRASEHSCYMRMYSSAGRALLHPKTVLSLCGHTVWISSLTIGLHALYAWALAIVS